MKHVLRNTLLLLSTAIFALSSCSKAAPVTPEGEEDEITPEPQEQEESTPVFAFSVSETAKVAFAPGNLQYQASTFTWRFAEHQYDCCGTANNHVSATYEGWIDLFGWGTGNNPTTTSTAESLYTTFVDWGKNEIGEDAPDTWRSLTKDELTYLFQNRANADSLYALATVNVGRIDEKWGLILLPDDWSRPEGVHFKAGATDCSINAYDFEQWLLMEEEGAVFLPDAGFRTDSYYPDPSVGRYWLGADGYFLVFNKDTSCFSFLISYPGGDKWRGRYRGHSVRLVRDL